MKISWTLRTFVAAAALAIGSLSLAAQMPDRTVTVKVPFGFEVGSRHFAPGTYTINTPMENIVMVRDHSHVAMIVTHWGQNSRPTRTTKIVFRRYDDRYFLRQVWFNAGTGAYVETQESKAEKQAKTSELASKQGRPSDVEVATLRLP